MLSGRIPDSRLYSYTSSTNEHAPTDIMTCAAMWDMNNLFLTVIPVFYNAS